MAPPPAPAGRDVPQPRWWGTLLYVPLLYGIGWLAVRPLSWLLPSWRVDQVDLAGVLVAFLLLLLSLPSRLRRAWGEGRPWRRLGVHRSPGRLLRSWLAGVGLALSLLTGVTLLLLLSGQARWQANLSPAELLNGVALLVGVGFAEELLFRGWLWGELEMRLEPRPALLLQAALFAALHPWHQLGGLAAVALFGGLMLLGLALALQRRSDGGSLWGAIGLHGGLVGGWFLLCQGGLQLGAAVPAWLIGPQQNPVGGLPGWLGLTLLLLLKRRWW